MIAKRIVAAALAGIFLLGLAGCGDPRKNCNHPEHEDYVREKGVKY